VNRFFKYSSISIQARSEEDVEEESVLSQLTRFATTEYDFSSKNRSDADLAQVRPVGTNYSRVQAEREIDLKAKTRFWSQVQQEEVQRKQEEAQRSPHELLKARELVGQRTKSNGIDGNGDKSRRDRSNERPQSDSIGTAKRKFEVPIQERESFWAAQEHEERQRRAEEQLRREEQRKRIESEIQTRETSAKALKRNFDGWQALPLNGSNGGKRTDAKADIERERKQMLLQHEDKENVTTETPSIGESALKMRGDQDACKESIGFGNRCTDRGYSNEAGKAIETEEVDTSFSDGHEKSVSEANEAQMQLMTANGSDDGTRQFPADEQLENDDQEEDDDEDLDEELCVSDILQPRRRCLEVIAEEEEEDDNLKVLLAGKGQCAKAIYDYQASDDQEISFDPDDIISHIQQTFDTWWEGLGPDNKYGLFPANYVELLN
jgi:hypothetical protein